MSSNRSPKLTLENSNRYVTNNGSGSPPSSLPNSASVMDSNHPLGTGRRFSFTQKLLGTSKELLSSLYSFGDKDDQSSGSAGTSSVVGSLSSQTEAGADDSFNPLLLLNERRRTSSISSDVSTDEHQPMERKNSISERLIAMQVGTFFS